MPHPAGSLEADGRFLLGQCRRPAGSHFPVGSRAYHCSAVTAGAFMAGSSSTPARQWPGRGSAGATWWRRRRCLRRRRRNQGRPWWPPAQEGEGRAGRYLGKVY